MNPRMVGSVESSVVGEKGIGSTVWKERIMNIWGITSTHGSQGVTGVKGVEAAKAAAPKNTPMVSVKPAFMLRKITYR